MNALTERCNLPYSVTTNIFIFKDKQKGRVNEKTTESNLDKIELYSNCNVISLNPLDDKVIVIKLSVVIRCKMFRASIIEIHQWEAKPKKNILCVKLFFQFCYEFMV